MAHHRKAGSVTAHTPLKQRTYLLPLDTRKEYPMAKAFLAPQREHAKQPMPVRAAA
jgi:hypothetical protein